MLLLLHRLLLVLLLVASIGGLIIQAPENTPPLSIVVMMLVLYLPLFIFFLPAWLADSRHLLWFCIVLLFYFCGFSTQVMSPEPLIYWIVARIALVVGLFATSSFLIRSRKA